MTAYRQEPWAGGPVEIVDPGTPGYEGNPIFGGRWDAPIADDPPVWNTPTGMRCYDCGTDIAAGDRGCIRGGIWADPDRPGAYISQVRPIHFECDLLGVLGCLHGICHCSRPVDTRTGQVGINIDDMPRRTAALLLLERINADRARRGARPM